MIEKSIRKNITQPPDWWAAFELVAKKRGISLSEYAGIQMAAGLTDRSRRKLSARPVVGKRKREQ